MKFLKETHIDFMRYRKLAYTISLMIIVLGMITFFSRGLANFGIDFTGGTLVRYKFAEVVDVGDIRILWAKPAWVEAPFSHMMPERES